jgi:RNA polymerase sigma factor (sigma-70 family)
MSEAAESNSFPLKNKVEQLAEDWYDPLKLELGRSEAPELDDLWKVALKMRREHGLEDNEELSLDNLFVLLWRASEYCLRKFDPARGKNALTPVKTRFVPFFKLNLLGRIRKRAGLTERQQTVKKKRRQAERKHDENIKLYREGRERAEKDSQWVRELWSALEPDEQKLLNCLYREDYSQEDTAKAMGLTRGKVQRWHADIIDRLRSAAKAA